VATRSLVVRLAPLSLLVLRLPVAGLVLLPWALPLLRQLHRRSSARLVVSGMLGLVGYNLPVTIGLQWVPASTAGLLLGTEPLWVLAFGAILSSEHVTRRGWAGAAVALVGTAVLAAPSWSGLSGGHALLGVVLVLAGASAFGAYTVVLRPLSATYGPLAATAASTVVGSVPYLALAGAVSMPEVARLPASAWAELGFLSIACTAAGLLCWNRAVLRAGSARLGNLLYVVPVVSVAGAVLLLGEGVSPATVAGGLITLSGVVLARSTWRPVP